ncbi:hypothetical protein [Ornithobacterium rhinotracheale]|uniref:hypothetical protein n=1 Tax=Ornithobacterium rhinotracheale TaxID=28251 RepID=UPI001FF143E4|nr:hypothetical protein [Ornithobacterium rhinotracheale]MCK0205354.1 hypothetical protein [Ornithobacterium rhinotracheale]
MNSIEIKEVKTKSQWKAFVYLPEKIHAQDPHWMPPLYMDEERFFKPEKNPAFAQNETILFLAYKNQKVIGRVMGIVPTKFNQSKKQNCARFSYLDCYEDFEVFSSLIHAVKDWARERNCDELIGPMGFSDKEPQGFVVKGFAEPSMMVTANNPAYLPQFIEKMEFEPFVRLMEYDVPLKANVVERFGRFTQLLLDKHKLTLHEFKRTREVKPFVSSVFDLINETYQNIYGFAPVSEAEKNEFATRFLPLLNPKLIKVVTNAQGKVVAFVVAMPDLSQGIKKARGRILPFGWWHIFRAFKKSKRLVLLLGAVAEPLQGKGIDAILGSSLISSALSLDFSMMDSHLIMEENVKMRREIERIPGNRLYKEFQIYHQKI